MDIGLYEHFGALTNPEHIQPGKLQLRIIRVYTSAKSIDFPSSDLPEVALEP